MPGKKFCVKRSHWGSCAMSSRSSSFSSDSRPAYLALEDLNQGPSAGVSGGLPTSERPNLFRVAYGSRAKTSPPLVTVTAPHAPGATASIHQGSSNSEFVYGRTPSEAFGRFSIVDAALKVLPR